MKTTWTKAIISSRAVLVPADKDADEWLSKTKLGQGVMIEPRRPRNLDHHRKLFALLNLAVDNWPRENAPTVEGLLDSIKVALGHVTPVEVRVNMLAMFCPELGEAMKGLDLPERVTVLFPNSISFESLDQTEFEPFYTGAMLILSKILGVDVETLREESET